MAPYPDHKQVAEIFSKIYQGGGGFVNHLDDNVDFHVMGHEHKHKGSHSSKEAVANDLFAFYDEFLDWNTFKLEIRHVIGGGEESWASCEATGSGLSHKGKPMNLDWVCVANFNTSGKIVEARVYFDTAHLDDHLAHAKA